MSIIRSEVKIDNSKEFLDVMSKDSDGKEVVRRLKDQGLYNVVVQLMDIYHVFKSTEVLLSLRLLNKKQCDTCGDGGWKECGCHVEGFNEGIQIAIKEVRKARDDK